eukprot:2363060-Amphidinium_carterae.1
MRNAPGTYDGPSIRAEERATCVARTDIPAAQATLPKLLRIAYTSTSKILGGQNYAIAQLIHIGMEFFDHASSK